MNRIATEMYTTPGRKILVLDEAWELMDDPLMAKAIEALYRKVRKNSGAVVFITQGVGDLFQSPNGRAIYANSAWQIVLEQRAESVDAAVASGQFSMDAFGIHQVKSLHVVPGEYSELMIKRSDSDYGIVRFRPDPFMFTLFASNGEERDEAIAAIEQGADPEKVIDFYTQKRLEKGN
jgi:conjugal transfer ATP-binding protein TraC